MLPPLSRKQRTPSEVAQRGFANDFPSCKEAVIWYNGLSMPHPTPIDITNMPDLVRIAEEVEATKTPRELKRENKTVAVIMPARKAPAKKKGAKPKADL